MSDPARFLFTFTVSHTVELGVEDIWPDDQALGNTLPSKKAPRRPTVDDVRRVVESCGGAAEVLGAWTLDRQRIGEHLRENESDVVLGDVTLDIKRLRRPRRQRPRAR